MDYWIDSYSQSTITDYEEQDAESLWKYDDYYGDNTVLHQELSKCWTSGNNNLTWVITNMDKKMQMINKIDDLIYSNYQEKYGKLQNGCLPRKRLKTIPENLICENEEEIKLEIDIKKTKLNCNSIINGYRIDGHNNMGLNPEILAKYLLFCIDLNHINQVLKNYNKIMLACMAKSYYNSKELPIANKYYHLYSSKYRQLIKIQIELSTTILDIRSKFILNDDTLYLVKYRLKSENEKFIEFFSKQLNN